MDEFNEIYQKLYQENSHKIETIQEKSKKRNRIVLGIFILIEIINLIWFKSFLFLVLFLAIVYFIVERIIRQGKYTKVFKEDVIKSLIEQYNQKLTYYPKVGIAESQYKEASFEKYDLYHSEDLITGELEDGSKIAMGEVKTENRRTDSDGNTHDTTVFFGLFATIEMTQFVRRIEIKKDVWFTGKSKQELHKVEMDSGEFEKQFNVYAEDSIQAMQVLTSDMMQMLLDFYETKKMDPEIIIESSKIYIRFHTGPLFELDLLKKVLDYDRIYRYYEILTFTLDFTQRFLKNVKDTQL